MQIKFFTTGGTIDKIYFDAKSEYQIGPTQIPGLLKQANVTFEYKVESLLRKDSLDLTDEDRALICRRISSDPATLIIITHGTDTMIQTAQALKEIPGKTIVLTGAMQPALFHASDALFNLGTAVAAVQTLPPGVYLAMNGRIFDPQHSRKDVVHQRFEMTP